MTLSAKLKLWWRVWIIVLTPLFFLPLPVIINTVVKIENEFLIEFNLRY